MARIVNGSKAQIARSRTDPNSSTASDLIDDIQGNAALTSDDATAGLGHTGSGDGCPLGIPYQCWTLGDGGVNTAINDPIMACLMIDVPAGEDLIEVRVRTTQARAWSIEIRDTSWALAGRKLLYNGGLLTARMPVTSGTKIIVVKTDGLTRASQELQSLSVAFPGVASPSWSTGEDDTVTVPSSFTDIDEVFSASGQGWSGFHCTTIDQNLNYLEEFITGGPCYPNETLALSSFYAPEPETYPVQAQSYGWIDQSDFGAAGSSWDAPGATTTGLGFQPVTASVITCPQGDNLTVRVMASSQDKTFGSSTAVAIRARVVDEGLSAVSTTNAGAWTQIGSTDLWYCTIAVSSNDVGINVVFVDANVTALSPSSDPDAFRLLSVSMHHAN